MKTLIVTALTATAALALACSDVKSGDGVAFACSGDAPATTVFLGSDSYDALSVQGGFVYVNLAGAGVQRCSTAGCAAPTPVLATDALVSTALATTITYTTEVGAPADEIRAVNLDGSGDHTLLGGLSYPAFVATSGSATFFAEDSFAVDDTPASVSCVGCTTDGLPTPWITGLGGATYGMMTDANHVYVLADDPSLMSVTLMSCGLTSPCFAEPRVVIGGLDRTITSQQIATDGTYVYVARTIENDLVRVDAAGTITVLVSGEPVNAVAVDARAGTVYFGTTTGILGRVRTDGTSQTNIACTSAAIAAVAVDDVSVYFLTGENGSNVLKAAK